MLGGQRSHKLELLLGGLETSVTEFGRSIDETKVDGFEVLSGGVVHHRLSQDKRSLLNSNNGSLKHDPVLIDLTVVNKSTHGCDGLLSQISLSLARCLITSLSNAVNLLVKFGTVEVTLLTGTGDGGGDTGRMPRSDTGDLTQTTVGLTGKTGDSPTGGDTGVTFTLGNSQNIHVFILAEDRVDGDFLLEERLGEGDLLGGVLSSVDLDLHDVGLLDAKVELLNLSVGNDTDDGAELGDTFQVSLNVGTSVLVFLSVTSVGLALGSEPVLVATTLEFITQVLSENSGQGSQTARGLNISDNSNNNHGRSLNDGNGIDDFTLVHESSGTVDSTYNVGHTGLVSTESGKVAGFGGVIVFGEGADLSKVLLGTLLGEESQVTTTGGFELSVRPVLNKLIFVTL